MANTPNYGWPLPDGGMKPDVVQWIQSLGNSADNELDNLESRVSQAESSLTTKAPLTNPTFAGTVTVPNGVTPNGAVNLSQLDAKADKVNPTFSGNVVVPTADAANEAVNKGQMDGAVADGRASTLRVRSESGPLRTGMMLAGSVAVTVGEDGRQNVSFGTAFSLVIGVVLTWGDDVNLPTGPYNTAYAPYVVTINNTGFTFGGGSGLKNMRINWLAYGV